MTLYLSPGRRGPCQTSWAVPSRKSGHPRAMWSRAACCGSRYA